MFKNSIVIIAFIISLKSVEAWKYQTKCTEHLSSSSVSFDTKSHQNEYNSILEDFEQDLILEQANENIFSNTNQNQHQNPDKLMRLKCPNLNDFLFIGLTQYGVSRHQLNPPNCQVNQNDCLVTVDYLANQCNGLNSCDIQLDAQFLHSCKNHSDYLTIAYECIPGSQRIDICSNEETFIIDSSQSSKSSDSSLSRFGSFYLSSPNYPNEYSNNLNNCTCKLDYVRIDNSNSNSNQDLTFEHTEMNLVFKAYEFDLEEADDLKCSKDYFKIESEKSSNSLCGQYKEFKEFYSSGKRFSLGFGTDDAITRRGFLVKISTSPDSTCPYGSSKIDSSKCIKFFGDDLQEKNSFKLNWYEASKSCQSLNGRLMSINDFVEDSKVNSFLRSRQDESYWSVNKRNETKCTLKRLNSWIEEPCLSKQAYICEFDPVQTKKSQIKRSGMSDNNGNRLIRVACGSASSLFSNSFKPSESTTSTTTKRVFKSNSITNTQKPFTKLLSKILPIVSQKPMINIIDYDYESASTKSSTEQQALVESSHFAVTRQSVSVILNQDMVLIIAIACGVSIVLIAVNIFCIWNYYNKKLKVFYSRNETLENQAYRSSTLMRSKTSSTNRTMSSTVDSYIKVPAYDLCSNQIEQVSACDSLLTSVSEVANNYNNNNNNELIKNFLRNQSQNQNLNLNESSIQHYYETLNKQGWSNYAEYNPMRRFKQFDSIVVLPSNHQYVTSATVPVNSTVVLLQSQQQQHDQQYSSVVYGDLSPTLSNQPLITFSSSSSGVSAI